MAVFKNMDDCMKKHPEADVLISFASLRSAYESTMETLNYKQVNSHLHRLFLASLLSSFWHTKLAVVFFSVLSFFPFFLSVCLSFFLFFVVFFSLSLVCECWQSCLYMHRHIDS